MAIFSLEHTYVGKRSQAAPFTASAHIRYICRSTAAVSVLSSGMTDAPAEWLEQQEPVLRRDARMIDKLRIALPAELSLEQNENLVRGFCTFMAASPDGMNAQWLVAIHKASEQGDDRNVHAHIAFCDRHPLTAKRVFGTSEFKSTERIRSLWQDHCNAALERAGVEARVDHRSLAKQGIDRLPGIHVGVVATAIQRDGRAPAAPRQITRRRVTGKVDTVDYGRYPRTRADENAERTRMKELATAAAAKKLEAADRQARADAAAAIAAQEAAQLEAGRQALVAEQAQQTAMQARLEAKQAANREIRRQERLAAAQRPLATPTPPLPPLPAVPTATIVAQPAEPAPAVGIDPRKDNSIRRQKWLAIAVDMLDRTPDAKERQEKTAMILKSWREMKEPKEETPRRGEIPGIQAWIRAHLEVGRAWLAEMLDAGRSGKGKPLQVPNRGAAGREASPKGRE